MARIQEAHDVIVQTQVQIASLGFGRERFLAPETDEDDLIAEGLMNRVFRVVEELGKISDDVARRYGFDSHAVRGVRNRLAHAYGEVDRAIVWQTIERDFPQVLAACRVYCDDVGIDLDD